MKTYLQGTFKLTDNIEDLAAYENEHKSAIVNVVDFADHAGFELDFTVQNDKSYVVNYEIIGKNYTACKHIQSELKTKLKNGWSKVITIFESSGDWEC